MAVAIAGGEQLQARPRWIGLAAWAIAGINAFDCLFTLAFLQLGLCEEANPFMRGLYDCSPWTFAGAKLAMVNLAVVLLLRVSTLPLARIALSLGASVYTLLAAYELFGLAVTLR
jgi:hypothetical protein